MFLTILVYKIYFFHQWYWKKKNSKTIAENLISQVSLTFIHAWVVLRHEASIKLALIPARCRGSFFFIKNILKNKNLKILDFFTKLYPGILSLAATSDLRVIFIILIIKLNLHDLSLSRPDCNTEPKNIGYGSGYKVVS